MSIAPHRRRKVAQLLLSFLSKRESKDPSPPPTGKSRIRSSVDETTPAFIRGWAFDPTSRDPVTIELRAEGGAVLVAGIANQPRPDVGRELGTDGLQGFWVPLPAHPSGKGSIEVFARSGSVETRLTVLEMDDESEFPPGSIELGDTMIVARREALTRILGNETLVICGPARGGTSIVAYILLCVGYYLGDKLGDDNHEDQEVLNGLGSAPEMEQLISRRNSDRPRWGFKVPDAIHHVDWLSRALRNPVFLVAYRNPVATAKSILKRDPIFGGGLGFRKLSTALAHGLNDMGLGSHVLRTKAPSILIDVDAARGSPERLVRDLVGLFAPGSSEQLIATIAREINSTSYKPKPSKP